MFWKHLRNCAKESNPGCLKRTGLKSVLSDKEAPMVSGEAQPCMLDTRQSVSLVLSCHTCLFKLLQEPMMFVHGQFEIE